jgi:hypothetical protein
MDIHLPKSFVRFGAFLGAVTLLIIAGTVAAQDPLDSWAGRYVTGLTDNLNAVAFGNGVFVAVGDNSTVATSTDGASWNVGSAGAYGNLLGVRFLNGEFVAVGSTDKILSSTDGTSWSAETLPSAGSWDVAYGNGVYVVAGNTTYMSSNGVDWVVSVPQVRSDFPPFQMVTVILGAVVFGNNRFVAVQSLHPAVPASPGLYSTNGIDWIQGGSALRTTAPGWAGDLIWENGLFLGAGRWNPNPSTSSDGVSWCCVANFPDPAGAAVAYGQGYFLFVQHGPSATGFTPAFWTSTNGTSWVTRFSIPMFYLPTDPNAAYYDSMKGQVRGAAFGNGTFVIVGAAGYIVQSGSLNGIPLILLQPQDRAAIVGNPASFSVQAVGTPPLGFLWFHNGSVIANATNSSHSIPQVQASDGGSYHVVITNSFGSVTSRVAQLSVAFLDIDSYAGIKILGVPGRSYRVEATLASGTPNWQVLTNVVLPSSPYIWIDYESPSVPARLYRAAELP